MMRNTKYKRAFTLVEALVALSILMIGVISGFILVTKALYDVSIIQDRLTASFLAQEGVELVRQIRDSNYVQNIQSTSIAWDKNLSDGDYLITTINNPPSGIKLLPYEDKVLRWDSSSGLYNYTSGDTTNFKRKINIQHINSDEIKVTVTIDWVTKGMNFQLVVEDFLYNWLKL
ncbi:MAG: type IV pilus modification PilV family protein [Minisyncoccia bacterium]